VLTRLLVSTPEMAVPFVNQLGPVAGRELGAGSKGGDWAQISGVMRLSCAIRALAVATAGR
jgi:hypothetical protein